MQKISERHSVTPTVASGKAVSIVSDKFSYLLPFSTSSSSSAEDKPIPKKASQEDKPQKPITAVYKDIKSRVDSRWKNPIPAVRTSKPSSSGAAGAAAVAATKPVPILSK